MGEVDVAEGAAQPFPAPAAAQARGPRPPSGASSTAFTVDWQAPSAGATPPSRRELLVDGAVLAAISSDEAGLHRVTLDVQGEEWTFRARIERGLEAVMLGRPARFLWTDRHRVRIVPGPREAA